MATCNRLTCAVDREPRPLSVRLHHGGPYNTHKTCRTSFPLLPLRTSASYFCFVLPLCTSASHFRFALALPLRTGRASTAVETRESSLDTSRNGKFHCLTAGLRRFGESKGATIARTAQRSTKTENSLGDQKEKKNARLTDTRATRRSFFLRRGAVLRKGLLLLGRTVERKKALLVSEKKNTRSRYSPAGSVVPAILFEGSPRGDKPFSAAPAKEAALRGRLARADQPFRSALQPRMTHAEREETVISESEMV